MGEDNIPDAQSIDKDSELIRVSQKEIGATDVLVCGGCHAVFHFIEAFKTHKTGNCSGQSALKDNANEKPQVWAFTLWKNAQYKNAKEGETPSSWGIYQEWCKLDVGEKDAWILAAKNIQTFTKLNDAKLVEVKPKPQVYGMRRRNQEVLVTVPSLSTGNKRGNDDPLEEGEIRLSQLPEAQRKALRAQTEANKVSDDADPLGGACDLNGKEGKENGGRNLIKRGLVKPVQLNSDVTILPSNKKQTRASTTNTTKTDEYGVEKIVSKRYNPKKKTFEYLVKWENSNKNEYTWEPTANLDSCKELLNEYEENLKKQRMQKAQAAALQKQYEKKKQRIGGGASSSDILEGRRPQRSSKQKALNQVKAWCGDISDGDEETSPVKRKFDDDSDSDSLEKKMRLDDDSESEDEIKPTVTVRKVTKTNPVNGVGGKKTTPIGKILIPDSKGIVRINQKQASELSSGVYIMSKTAGIIKLDSNASKFATSGGQAIVKVEPRIGQTQIKVVKKDASTSSVKLTPKPKITLKSVGKVTKEKPAEVKKSPTVASTPAVHEKKEFDDDKGDDSDDGIPEFEFPKDLPLPEPESPPGDFVLDPETGKIVGQDYPEESVVVAVEKVDETEKEEENVEKKEEMAVDEEEEDEKETEEEKEIKKAAESNLENLVKLAAADILDDEMKEAEEEEEQKQQQQQPQKVSPTVQSTPVKQVTKEVHDSPMFRTAQTSTPTTSLPSSSSTPATASGSSILQRKLLSTPKPQQKQTPPTIRKVMSSTVAALKKTTPVITPVVRRTVVTKPPRQYVPMNTPPTISRVRQSYSNKNLNVHKKIGQTTIYRTVQKSPQQKVTSVRQIIHPQTLLQQQVKQQQQQQHQQQLVQRPKPKILNREPVVQQKPQTVVTTTPKPKITKPAEQAVINMPSLTLDETQPPPPEEIHNQEEQQQPLEEQQLQPPTPLAEEEPAPTISVPETGMTDLSTTLAELNESETPLIITGEDGTIYQVAGQNEQGQTILISQGADGQSQCLVVATESLQLEENQQVVQMGESGAVGELQQEQQQEEQQQQQQQQEESMIVDETSVAVAVGDAMAEGEVGGVVGGEEESMVAQLISADPPSPGGRRNVTVMLPDGSCVTMQVTQEQYESLELDK